jgi:putative membrane protein
MKSAALRRPKKDDSTTPSLVTHYRDVSTNEHIRNMKKGAIAGLVGGLIGTIVMTAFQNGWSKATASLKGENNQQQEQHNGQESEDATMKVAGKLSEAVGHPLSHEQRKKFGPVVHYVFGTAQGALYGAVTELAGVRGGLLGGVSFGAALFVFADEIGTSALGLSGKPTDYPLSSHAYALASHLVYGVTTEIARRGLRSAL